MLKIGSEAPSFSAVDQHGYPCSLETLLRDGPLVLYFYPRDFSFVCTREACAFRDEHESLTIAGAMICGVSSDSSSSHERFADVNEIPFPLIADPDREIVDAYDVRSIFGIAKRVTYVIGTDGRIASVHHHELSARRHVEEVKRTLSGLGVVTPPAPI
jgi:peroxiredoxin Q/BCP